MLLKSDLLCWLSWRKKGRCVLEFLYSKTSFGLASHSWIDSIVLEIKVLISPLDSMGYSPNLAEVCPRPSSPVTTTWVRQIYESPTMEVSRELRYKEVLAKRQKYWDRIMKNCFGEKTCDNLRIYRQNLLPQSISNIWQKPEKQSCLWLSHVMSRVGPTDLKLLRFH